MIPQGHAETAGPAQTEGNGQFCPGCPVNDNLLKVFDKIQMSRI
jgi:hypothetical protein